MAQLNHKNNAERIVTFVVVAIYLLLLLWLVLFKFATTIEEIPHMRNLNLILFHYDEETSTHWQEVIYNVVLFIPVGFYFSVFFSKKTPIYC